MVVFVVEEFLLVLFVVVLPNGRKLGRRIGGLAKLGGRKGILPLD